jgi:hypothetical protein
VREASQSDPWYSEVPVSDDKDLDRPADEPGKIDTAESDDELDALDRDGGFDQAVARARDELDPTAGERPFTEEEAGMRKVGWGRSPIISVAVIIVGLFLLGATWSDFRYFLRSLQSEPRDLGHISDIYVDGKFTESFDDEWVIVEGDPDVQHAARMPAGDAWVGFMRLVEADASMFVAIPRSTQDASTQFPGRFEGRMRRLDKVPQWEKLQTFFNAEEIVEMVDIAPASLVDAVGNGSTQVQLTDGSQSELASEQELRLVVSSSAAMTQLGRTTWATPAEAEAAVAALGRPWAFVEKRDTVWVFAVEVGANAPVEVYQQLTRTLNGGKDLADPDPKVGALVLPRRTTYLVALADLQLDGPALSFTYGENTAEPGWTRDGDKLVPVALAGGRLAVPTAAIEAVRVERTLKADPDGYLLLVDLSPKDVWPSAVMFLAVLAVVALNGLALASSLRRRRAGA